MNRAMNAEKTQNSREKAKKYRENSLKFV